MALEGIAVETGNLIGGLIALIIGGILMAVNNRIQRPYNLILLIGGAIVAIIGIVLIILAFI